jgi:hypothetical protein
MCHTFKTQNFVTYLHWKLQGLEIRKRRKERQKEAELHLRRSKTVAEEKVKRPDSKPECLEYKSTAALLR